MTFVLVLLHVTVHAILTVRVLLRRDMMTEARATWIVVILALPVLGILLYLLFGEARLGRRRVARMHGVIRTLSETAAVLNLPAKAPATIPERHRPLFALGHAVSRFQPLGGNAADLMPGSNATIDRLVADIDAASNHVHLLYFIWLPDNNGRKVAEALIRAAGRGVTCRAMVDDMGSRALIHSATWKAMAAAGVKLARALPIGWPLFRAIVGRIDLRNHRKVAVIDNRVAYCGSQNCADPEFLPKGRYAPWVDLVLRVEGPAVRQNQFVFAADWTAATGEDLRDLLMEPVDVGATGFAAQAIASGPALHRAAMPEVFAALIHAARHSLVITTPYYVPTDAIQSALRVAAHRGVAVDLVLPRRNDNRAVGATARSHYADLLEAGVRIHEFRNGLLHAKSLTLDGEIAFIGTANMDLRSFRLNYENNLLISDEAVTATIRERQASYIAESDEIALQTVSAWPWYRRLLNNTLALLSPIL